VKTILLRWLVATVLIAAPGIILANDHGGFHGHGGGHGEFHGHGGYNDGHHHFHGHSGVFIGIPFWAPWPYYFYPPSVYSYPPPPAYIEQEQGYWHYCPNPPGYYPYVNNCSEPWMLVPAR